MDQITNASPIVVDSQDTMDDPIWVGKQYYWISDHGGLLSEIEVFPRWRVKNDKQFRVKITTIRNSLNNQSSLRRFFRHLPIFKMETHE
jgi:hypothetical protein